MKTLRAFWREFVCVFLTSCLGCWFFWWLNSPPQTSFGRFVHVGGFLLCLLLIYRTLRSLWRLKWSLAFTRIGQMLFTKASRFLIRAFEKWMGHGKRGKRSTLLYGTTTVTFDRTFGETQVKKNRKTPKWKQLQSNRERLGFLYRHMITARIKSGMRAYAFDTPAELRTRAKNTPTEENLFSLYVNLRYDDRIEPDPQSIAEIKENFEIR